MKRNILVAFALSLAWHSMTPSQAWAEPQLRVESNSANESQGSVVDDPTKKSGSEPGLTNADTGNHGKIDSNRLLGRPVGGAKSNGRDNRSRHNPYTVFKF